MIQKIVITCVFTFLGYISASGQKIVVDTTSTSKYIIKKKTNESDLTTPPSANHNEEEISFSDRALSIGQGILNRLKARLNLEEAAESIKEKKDRFVGSNQKEEEDDT